MGFLILVTYVQSLNRRPAYLQVQGRFHPVIGPPKSAKMVMTGLFRWWILKILHDPKLLMPWEYCGNIVHEEFSV